MRAVRRGAGLERWASTTTSSRSAATASCRSSWWPARAAGLVITPREVSSIRPSRARRGCEPDRRAGRHHAARHSRRRRADAPIMRWLIERGGPIERFSQATLLRVPARLREVSHRALQGAARSPRCAAAARDDSAQGGDMALEIAPAGTVDASAPASDRCVGARRRGAASCIGEERRKRPSSGLRLRKA